MWHCACLGLLLAAWQSLLATVPNACPPRANSTLAPLVATGGATLRGGQLRALNQSVSTQVAQLLQVRAGLGVGLEGACRPPPRRSDVMPDDVLPSVWACLLAPRREPARLLAPLLHFSPAPALATGHRQSAAAHAAAAVRAAAAAAAPAVPRPRPARGQAAAVGRRERGGGCCCSLGLLGWHGQLVV